jgi:DNA repair protein RecN (Recombination protein N)
LKQLLSKEQEILGSKADILSQKRLASIPAFQTYLESSLMMMGIEKPTFKVSHLNQSIKQFDDTHLIANTSNGPFIAYSHGIDIIEFMLSLNSGEECKPLVKAASGGEISRIMLALKSLINEKAGVPVMVFDEIDTGISGKVARKVGSVMKQLGIHKQVIAISHSPQIASLADNHVLVRKTSASDSTKVDAMTVIDDERIKEIASLISGETLTETTIESAKELLSAKDIHKG